MTPTKPSDPCYHWKEYRLDRIAAEMRAGRFGTSQPTFTDDEKVSIALDLKRQYAITGVWIEAGRLYYRDGLQGSLCRLSWYHAAVLTGLLDRPKTRQEITRKGVGKELQTLRRQRYIETA